MNKQKPKEEVDFQSIFLSTNPTAPGLSTFPVSKYEQQKVQINTQPTSKRADSYDCDPPKLKIKETNGATNTNVTTIPDLSNSGLGSGWINLSDLSRLLVEASLNSSLIQKKFEEGNRFCKLINGIKDAFLARVKDIDQIQNSQSSQAADAHFLMHLNSLISEFHKQIWTLNNKILKLLGVKSPVLAGSPTSATFGTGTRVSFGKKKLMKFVVEVHDSWVDLIVHVAMVLASRSSKTIGNPAVHFQPTFQGLGTTDWIDAPEGNMMSLSDSENLFIQGDKYLFGYGFSQSYDQAFKRYQASANCGFAAASNMLGVMYENGLGKQKDMNLALHFYRAAADQNCPDALNNMGRIYQHGIGCKIDYSSANDCYSKAAEMGCVDAMVNIGHLLEHGLNGNPNPTLAFHWYQTAANKDYAKAQNSIGSLFYKGMEGFSEANSEEAVQWFRKSALQGNAHALNNLGICYEEGKGVFKDYGIAKQYYKEASSLMHPSATNNYGYMLLLENLYDEAIRYFHLGMTLGNADSAYNLGTLYEIGCIKENIIILKKDLEMAIKYYKTASKSNHLQADLRLGTIYLTAPEPIQSAVNAMKYLLNAATFGDNADAQNLIGQMKELNLGETQDEERKDTQNESNSKNAKYWYSKAVAKGHLGAIGSIYETGGHGAERDLDKAILYYQQGAKNSQAECIERLADLVTMGLAK